MTRKPNKYAVSSPEVLDRKLAARILRVCDLYRDVPQQGMAKVREVAKKFLAAK